MTFNEIGDLKLEIYRLAGKLFIYFYPGKGFMHNEHLSTSPLTALLRDPGDCRAYCCISTRDSTLFSGKCCA